MFKKIIISIFMVGSLAFAPAAFAEPVILVFDVDRAIAMSKAGKSMAKQLEEQVSKVRADEGEVLKGLQSEAEKLREQQKLLAPEALQKKVEELRLKEVERRRVLSEKSQSIQAGGQRAAAEIVRLLKKSSPKYRRNAKPILLCVAKRYFLPARRLMSRLTLCRALISG